MSEGRSGVAPGFPGNLSQDEISRYDDHLRRISTALYGAGMLAVLLVANTKLVRSEAINGAALNWIVCAAGISVVGILLFPWYRYDRNLFLVAALDGLCLVALAVYFSGGWESPFYPFYFFVVVFCAIYFSPKVAAAAVFFTVLVSFSPQLYAPEAPSLMEHAMVRVPTYVALAFVSSYMAREVGRRERLRGEYERRLREVSKLKERYQREASTDRLTDLSNRSHFGIRLWEELDEARWRGEELMILFLDLDDFKRINDTHGHRVGDKCLRLVADALSRNVRDTDVVARHGGEEFTVLLVGTSPAGAQEFFDRTRKRLAERSEQELGFRLHLSAGAASFPRDSDDPDELLELADRAMYQAKQLGKDQLFYHPMKAG